MQGSSRHRREAEEAERFRDAAETAIDQLDWVINYLFSIQKPQIAAALRRNRRQICKQLR